jgi:hypothetical protein
MGGEGASSGAAGSGAMAGEGGSSGGTGTGGGGEGGSSDGDSDGDGISDADEGAVENVDTDGDGTPDYQDLDADADTIPDSVEAGDADIATPPIDSENDGIPNYLDLDSDNDGLSDLLETAFGTDTADPDTDGDGTSDLGEYAVGTNANDPMDDPGSHDASVFIMPYLEPSTPVKETLPFRTSIEFSDVYFGFDTTGSMSAELSAMGNATTGIPAIADQLTCPNLGAACQLDADCGANAVCFQTACIQDPTFGQGCIPDLWTGVGRWDDLDTYQNIVSLQPDAALTATAVPPIGGGAAEAPYQPSHCIADPNLCPNAPAKNCGSQGGDIGCPGFRLDAFRIYIQITDADQQCSGATCPSFTAASAGAALQAAGIKFVGLYGTDDAGGIGTPQSVATDIGIASGTVDQSNNPFVYLAIDAAVVSNTVAAVLAVTKSQPLYTTIEASDDPADAVDALQFVDYLEVNASGGACTNVAPVADTDNDGYNDAFPALLGGTPVCWDVRPVAQNAGVMPTGEVQVFQATLTVRGDGSLLDARKVYFVVPPTL